MTLLASKHWFGFDLDDTLHEFCKASAYASRSVFKAIQAIHPESTKTIDELEATYREILRPKTATAFTDGRSSASSKAVIVVTEGPQDAQEWTVSELGLKPFIDILVTTNEVGKSKVDGLFPAVLEKHNIASGDVVYVGDNQQRDILPAQAAGIDTVLYDENSNCNFDDPRSLRVNSLLKLAYLAGCSEMLD